MVSLKAAHEKPKGMWMGVGVFGGKVVDMMETGVVEPLSVKEQAIKSATEATSMILRVDDVIASAKPSKRAMPPMPPGAGPEGY